MLRVQHESLQALATGQNVPFPSHIGQRLAFVVRIFLGMTVALQRGSDLN